MSDSNDKSLERKHKSIYIQRNYWKALGDLANELYGDEKKRSQVIERLLDQTHHQPTHTQVKEVIKENATLYGAESDTNVAAEDDDDDETEDEEVTLENMKNNSVNHAQLVLNYLSENEESDRWTVEEVTTIVQREAGYSRYRARQKAESALSLAKHKIDIPELVEEYKQHVLSQDKAKYMRPYVTVSMQKSESTKRAQYRNTDPSDIFSYDYDVVYCLSDRAALAEYNSLIETSKKQLDEPINVWLSDIITPRKHELEIFGE